jgi:hypothetical protein
MGAAIARLLALASATAVANIDAFVTAALFSGLGLLLSLSVLILELIAPEMKNCRTGGLAPWFISSFETIYSCALLQLAEQTQI